MKVKDMMTSSVIKVGAEEPVEVAARTMTHYNIGALPVCDASGRLCGIVTDRDIVTRCLAAGREAKATKVRQVMTAKVQTIASGASEQEAATLMGRNQIRRLPVTENGNLCGMLSLGDLSQNAEAGNTLNRISRVNITNTSGGDDHGKILGNFETAYRRAPAKLRGR